MTHTRQFLGLAEAACILGLAGFLVYLLVGGDYWMYLNPKFKELSWTAAVALGSLGIYSLARPPAGATCFRACLYLSVLGLCVLSELGLQRGMAALGAGAPQEQEQSFPSQVTLEGVEYGRINLGELYGIVGNGPSLLIGKDWAVRGFVRRSPENDAKGEFVLYRLAVYCCFADSTAVGFRVRPPKGEDLPGNGTWLVAYGRLSPNDATEPDKVESIEGMAFSAVNPDYRIDARRLEIEKVPGMGMMYEWRAEAPYAY